MSRTRKWLGAGRFDLVHVHEPFAPSIAMLALRVSDVPVVATLHASTDRARAVAGTAGLIRAMTPRIAAAIAVSRSAEASWAVNALPVVLVPNGVFCSDFGAARDEMPLPDPARCRPGAGPPTVLFLGRCDEPRKGLPVLRAAFDRVAAQVPGARLVLAGPTTRPRRPRSTRRPAGVVELGPVSDQRRAGLLAAADVFVAPNTRAESFGLVLVEAMASGTAVAASDLPAFCDLLGNGRYGTLFRAGQVDSCARALTALLTDRERRRRQADAGRHAARRYDWSQIAPHIIAVYESVLDGRRPAAGVVRAAR
jgi:phosphatidylinositol alpha-mannosyltransferase